MLSRCQLIIFAKAPIPGKVKTRLAAKIGAEAAAQAQTEMLQMIATEVSHNRMWSVRLAVTPDEMTDVPGTWPLGAKVEPQGEGDLGQRMARFLAGATPEAPVAIVGSDIPELKCAHIEQAFNALQQAPLVFGPTYDGGFWLVGASSPPPERLFDGVAWSSHRALQHCLRNAEPLRPKLVDRLEDIDDESGYLRWRKRNLES